MEVKKQITMFLKKYTAGLLCFYFCICISSEIYANNSQANDQKSRKNRAPNEVVVGIGPTLWQESVSFTKSGESTDMNAQFQGLDIDAKYVLPLRSLQWSQFYGLNFGLGVVRGTAAFSATTDEFRNQSWFHLGVTPGLVFKGSPVSQIKLGLPLVYRSLSWNFKSGSSLQVEKPPSFSPGLQLQSSVKYSKNQAIFFSASYYPTWKTTQWTIGWHHYSLLD
jgi:hypothetical protein